MITKRVAILSALFSGVAKAQTELAPGVPPGALDRVQSFQSNGTDVTPAPPLPGLPAGAWVIDLDHLFNDMVITYKGESIVLTPDKIWNELKRML